MAGPEEHPGPMVTEDCPRIPVDVGQLISKWLALVLLNAVVGLLIGSMLVKSPLGMLGIGAGVVTWTAVYVMLEWLLIQSEFETMRKGLVIGACFRALTQIIFVGDMYAGFVASILVEEVFSKQQEFLYAYAMTLTTGFFLSLVCGVASLVIAGALQHIREVREGGSQ